MINQFKNEIVLGVDEAGRGPLAGPVCVAGCIFKEKADDKLIHKLKDSKQLTGKAREAYFDAIKENTYHHIVLKSAEEIDRKGISKCISDAIEEIFYALESRCDICVFDGNWNPMKGEKKFTTLVKADDLVKEVSAASILAKVTRDRIMVDLEKDYPGYGFDFHKGYGTKKHLDAIKKLGLTKEHRKTFKIKGVSNLL